MNIHVNHLLVQLFKYTAETLVIRAVALNSAFSALKLRYMQHLICLFVLGVWSCYWLLLPKQKIMRLSFSVWRGSDLLCFLRLDTVGHRLDRRSVRWAEHQVVNWDLLTSLKPKDWNQRWAWMWNESDFSVLCVLTVSKLVPLFERTHL